MSIQHLQTLYHGSKTAGIKILRPQKSNLLAHEVVFATPDIRFALAMIHGTGESIDIGYFSSSKTKKKQMYINELQPGSLHLLQQAGSLYLVAAAGFVATKHLTHSERIKFDPVKVQEELRIANILHELTQYDIDIVEYHDVPAYLQARRHSSLEQQS